MAQYTPIFEKPYENGYENLPSQNTPITAETLNDKDDAIVNIESYLSENDIPSDAEGLSYDNTDSGLTADNVQSAIDELNNEKLGVDDFASSVDVITNTTGQFSTITGGLLESCNITLEPVQSGSGTPSPQNVRPITGHTSVEVDVTDADSNTTQYTIALGQTVYGGELDAVSGVLTVTWVSERMLNTYGWSLNTSPAIDRRFQWNYGSGTAIPKGINQNGTFICSHLNPSNISVNSNPFGYFYISQGWVVIPDRDSFFATLDDFKNWLSNNEVYICYKLATPIIIQLTPQQIETLIGENNVSVPLTGQSLDELTYREVLAWDDVERAVSVKLDLSSVAPIEYTDKASKPYNQKQLFIKDGKLCQALASISSGASFTENTNFKYTTLAEIIEPLIP